MLARKQLTASVSLDMQEDDSERLLHFLRCRKCDDLAHNAVETECCRALLCASCLEDLARQCPDCRAACKPAPSHLARRLIGTQPWRCAGCGKETTRSEQADHCLTCSLTERKCPASGCEFCGLPDAFITHLTEAHKNQLLRRVECLFEPAVGTGGQHRSSDPTESLVYGESSFLDMFDMPPLGRMSPRHFFRSTSSRTQVRFTGKNYCRGPLNGPACNCCDGNCGPANGCNCVTCMRRDLLTFRVRTPRTLVNREGAVARMSSETGKFYCGRPVMQHDPSTDGFCGPDNGNNCHACGKLDEQVLGRYAEIAAEWADDGHAGRESRDFVDLNDSLEADTDTSMMAYDTTD